MLKNVLTKINFWFKVIPSRFKHKVAIKLEAKYQDLLLFYNAKRIPEPFCLIDMNIVKETQIEVTIAEGAEIGLDKLRA